MEKSEICFVVIEYEKVAVEYKSGKQKCYNVFKDNIPCTIEKFIREAWAKKRFKWRDTRQEYWR